MSAVALCEVELVPEAQGWVVRATLRWQDAKPRQAHDMPRDIFSAHLRTPFEQTDPDFQLTAAAFAKVLRARSYVDATYGEIARFASAAADHMPKNNQAHELAEMIFTAERLDHRH